MTILAGGIRFLRLGSIPVALYCDEAFNAYESWSLLLTWRDTRGVMLPLFFDIFGRGWGEPLYFYLSIPSIALFGLTPTGARATAAIAGTLTVVVTGLLTRTLLRDALSPRSAALSGLGAAGTMALSPWAFHFSRIGFQASLLPLALTTGFWLIAGAISQGMRPRTARLAAGSLVLGLSLYTYTVSRVVLPLLLAGFYVLMLPSLRRAPGGLRAAIVSAGIVVLMAAPIASFSLGAEGQRRFSDVSIMNRADLAGAGPIRMAGAMAGNYASYFSPAFLLTRGDDNPRHSIRGHGALHPHEILLVIFGIVAAVRARTAGTMFLLWWTAVAPVAAALTVDARHAVRAIPMVPALHALAGLGIAQIVTFHARVDSPPRGVTPDRMRRVALAVMLATALVVTSGYFRDYFIRWPEESAAAWQYGLDQVYEYVGDHLEGHDSVYMTRNEDYPWIHLLFYEKIHPRLYQEQGLSGMPYLFDQEVFYRGDAIHSRRNPIFVLKPWELDDRLVPRHVIRYPDGSEAFVIAW